MLRIPFLLRFDSHSNTPHSEFRTMKGPFERLKYDLRRVWECPVCKRRERTAGTVTYRHCQCRMKQVDGQPVVMKLVEDGVQRVTPPLTIQHDPLPPSAPVEASLSAPPPVVDAESAASVEQEPNHGSHSGR